MPYDLNTAGVASCVHILEGDGVVHPQLSELTIPVEQSVTVFKMEMKEEIASKKDAH
jgi:hypothetical protein